LIANLIDRKYEIQSAICNLQSEICNFTISSLSCDVDASRAAAAGLRQRQREESLGEVGCHALDVDGFGEDEGAREAAVAALDPMILLAGHLSARAIAANHHATFFGVYLDLFA
jgi:hypothetical protein